MAFVLNSPAFRDGDTIPARYTQDGDNLSPPLVWRDPPPGTRSFALILDDAVAPGEPVRHWLIYDIPPNQRQLVEGAGNIEAETPCQAVNNFGNKGYDGPAPPKGRERRTYRFRLAALDVPQVELSAPATAAVLWEAVEQHTIRQAEMIGISGPESAPAEPRGAPDRHRRRPDKGEPVMRAGDAGGPDAGRNLTTADIDHDAGGAPPNVLEPTAYAADKPSRRRKRR